jgi:hypothetical protein
VAGDTTEMARLLSELASLRVREEEDEEVGEVPIRGGDEAKEVAADDPELRVAADEGEEAREAIPSTSSSLLGPWRTRL